MDRANQVGLDAAFKLGLEGIEVFRRYGNPAIQCKWACGTCGRIFTEKLAAMSEITAWQASCPKCVKEPWYRATIDNVVAQYNIDVLAVVYPQAIYGAMREAADTIKITFICRKCHEQRQRSIHELRQGHICSCNARNTSRGEAEISTYLTSLGRSFIRECPLARLGLGTDMRFDFYLEQCQTAIEYDGTQHFQPIDHFGGLEAYLKLVERDRLKDAIAAGAGIRLIRIAYTCKDVAAFLEQSLAGKPAAK